MKSRSMLSLSIVAAASLAASQTALAQGVGNLSTLPVNIPQNPGAGWNVGTPLSPIPVVRDPNGPKWFKHFTDPNGWINPLPGQPIAVHESLLIAPTLDWSDWHEEILTPGWDWAPQVQVMLNGGGPPPGLTIVNTPGTMTQGGTLSLYFNPLAPGNQIDIRKLLVYTGPAGIAIPSIEIAQYPTPEPVSLLMLAGGGLVMLRRRFGLGRSQS